MFETISWKDDKVVMIDQRILPVEEKYLEFSTYLEVAEAIKSMVIRGAPAIGVAAAMGIALGALNIKTDNIDDFENKFNEICRVISETRPTAVNLFWATERMKRLFMSNRSRSIDEIKNILKKEALSMKDEDIKICRMIGKNGAKFLEDGCTVLTHCNAGGLATAGYGTALGVIRAAHEEGKKLMVFADETRPFLQGARLTAWELMRDNIPVTLITDNMAGYFMKKGRIDAVVVGADRIAANGDTANKIGTYSVAVLAKENGIPFYVAAPMSTVDFSLNNGSLIPIEERGRAEVTHVMKQKIAPEDVIVENPAFDITPGRYISGIITERGVATEPFEDNLASMC